MYQSLFSHSPTGGPLLLRSFGSYEWSCCKHPWVDGAPAARFLKALADKLEKFNLILAL